MTFTICALRTRMCYFQFKFCSYLTVTFVKPGKFYNLLYRILSNYEIENTVNVTLKIT
jgi:hypothetical protein